MKYLKLFRVIAAYVVISTVAVNAGTPKYSAERIFQRVQSRLDSVRDYSAEITVDVDIPNLRMPKKTLKIFYKKPDKFTVKTTGFAIVPKMGLIPSQIDLLTENTMQEIRSLPDQNEDNAYIIDVHPLEPTVKIETTVWINAESWTIDKILLAAAGSGESVITIQYDKIDGIWLPRNTTVYLNLLHSIPQAQRPSVEFPVGYHGKGSGDEPMNGIIYIEFSNYRLNQGLDDKLFEK